MYKERLFNLIREEDVILWIGAGMSLYAGFPSGNRLSEIFIENLTTEEKKQVNKHMPLSELTEQIYRLKGGSRYFLIRTLDKTFRKRAKFTHIHNSLAKISHFKTIITTNYDTLLEDSYAEKGQLIFKTSHIPYIDNRKKQIFKVHGDLSEPDSVIITKSDYNNFFKNYEDISTFWAVIRERLATKSVLFIGYNLEDPNVSVVFDRIIDSLGENKKEHFFVAPNLSKIKEGELMRRGIHYINSTAEKIIPELITQIKEHIISDVKNGKTSADTSLEFLKNIGLLPELKAKSDNYEVTALSGINNNVQAEGKFTIKNKNDIIKELNKYIKGEKFGVFEIPKDKLVNIDFKYGGVKFPKSEEIVKVGIVSRPSAEGMIDIVFNDGFELNNVTAKLYKSSIKMKIDIELDVAKIILEFKLDESPETKVNFTYEHKEICGNTKIEIEFFSFLKRLFGGVGFIVYSRNEEIVSRTFPLISDFINQADYYLNYFTILKEIETIKKIRFTEINFNEINDVYLNKANYTLKALKQEVIEVACDDEIVLTLIENYSDDTIQHLNKINSKNESLIIPFNHTETVNLHGIEFNLGYKTIEFKNISILNFNDILERKSNVVQVQSEDKKYRITYSNTNKTDASK